MKRLGILLILVALPAPLLLAQDPDVRKILDAYQAARPNDRELEIFQLIGRGNDTHAIAAQLNLSPKTVDVHRAHIKEKLELKDATSLVRHAVRWVETQSTGEPERS